MQNIKLSVHKSRPMFRTRGIQEISILYCVVLCWTVLYCTVLNCTVLHCSTNSDKHFFHYDDVIMSEMASQTTSLTIVCSSVYSGADKKKKHQSSASLAFVRGIHRWPVNSPHKAPVARIISQIDDVIMDCSMLFTSQFCVTQLAEYRIHCKSKYSNYQPLFSIIANPTLLLALRLSTTTIEYKVKCTSFSVYKLS